MKMKRRKKIKITTTTTTMTISPMINIIIDVVAATTTKHSSNDLVLHTTCWIGSKRERLKSHHHLHPKTTTTHPQPPSHTPSFHVAQTHRHNIPRYISCTPVVYTTYIYYPLTHSLTTSFFDSLSFRLLVHSFHLKDYIHCKMGLFKSDIYRYRQNGWGL